MLKFNQYHVTDGVRKAKVFYSLDNHATHPQCVTLYARDYSDILGQLFPADYRNQTDIQTDYVEHGHVTLTPGHPAYTAARARAERVRAHQHRKARTP